MQIPVGKGLTVAIVALLAAATIVGAADAPATEEAIEPDQEFQPLLENYFRSQRWTPEFYQHLIALRARARALDKEAPQKLPKRPGPPVWEGHRRLIRQAAHYCAQQPSPGKFKSLIRDLGVYEYPDYGIMAALLPYLDTKDERLRTFILTEVLDGDGQNEAFERDARDPVVNAMLRYISFDVRMAKREMPWSVVQILYWKAPSVAVHAFSTIPREEREERRALHWAQHVVQDVLWKKGRGFLKPGELDAAIAELDKLSKFDDWAVKLYVAEMLRRHEEFRDQKIVERLRKDQNQLVAKAFDVPFRAEEKEERGFFGF